jgi:hypothetical protein
MRYLIVAAVAAFVFAAWAWLIEPFTNKQSGFTARVALKVAVAQRLHRRVPFLQMGCAAVACMLLMFAPALLSQTVPAPVAAPTLSNLYTLGLSYSPGADKPVAGSASYFRQVNDSGTYVFTMVDAHPSTSKPFTVTTSFGVGIAQKVATIAGMNIYVPTNAGIAYSGSAVGWNYSSGVGVAIRWKAYKDGYLYIVPTARFDKNNVTNDGFQPIGGVQIGWGK